jgi:DNA-binding response OmpR family regulator
MKTPKQILILGGEARLRDALAQALESGGAFRVTDATGAAEAMPASQQRLDAIIVQPTPADGDGAELCARLRRRGLRIPIVVLADTAAEQEIVRALDAGANDYLVRPFRLAELKARLGAQIREHETSEDAVLPLGPYHFRPGARVLYLPAEDRNIRLTHKEVTILKCLYHAAGRPVSRQTLLREVWSYSSGARTHTVETHIYRLRRKIEPDPARPTVIVNDDDGGYRLGPPGDADTAPPPLRLALVAAR